MSTPVWDFVRRYAGEDPLRLHMPGHKGVPGLGPEPWDLTEIPGADSLYEATGILRESEEEAGRLYGCPTFYSAEGSSLAVRAMVFLACRWALDRGKRPKIAAARNVHRTFVTAAALLDVPLQWISGETCLQCTLDPAAVEAALEADVTALYCTSPDYLGHIQEIEGLARLCRRRGILLLVDNAHGAYLRFLPVSRHPMDLGADLCCASAHKTLPALTGAAYLHIAAAHGALAAQAKAALALFGSTSPSYLILASLDRLNGLLAGDYPRALAAFLPRAQALKTRLAEAGWQLTGSEPLKLTLCPKGRGYTGTEIAEILQTARIYSEFADPDYLVLMLTPALSQAQLDRLAEVLEAIPLRRPIRTLPPPCPMGPIRLTPRAAAFAPSETVPVDQALGRILAETQIGCPPAVPIAVCGEELTPEAVAAFRYYGVTEVRVVRSGRSVERE